MTQSNHASLLVELLTEELPPKALARLGTAFADGIVERLAARDLIDGAPVFEKYATPRRLAVLIRNVRDVAPEKQVREKVLPVSVALDKEGNPTPPLAKKLAALGFPDFPLAELERAQDGKAEAFFLRYAAPGATLADGLQAALDETLGKLPIPKVMTYQRPDGTSVQFVRPVQRLVAMHGRNVVPVSALGAIRAIRPSVIDSCRKASSRFRTPTNTPTRCAAKGMSSPISTIAANRFARSFWRSPATTAS